MRKTKKAISLLLTLAMVLTMIPAFSLVFTQKAKAATASIAHDFYSSGINVYVNYSGSVSSITAPTWSDYNGQDDIGTWPSMTAGSWTVYGNTYNYRVQIPYSSHKYNSGLFHTHIYVNGSYYTAEDYYVNCPTKPYSTEYYYASGTQFIYQLILYYSSKSNDKAREWLTNNGWTDWSGNFNAGDGHSSDYVHSGYKTTTDPTVAIKKVLVADGHPSTVSYGGQTYYAVGGGGSTQTPTGGDGCVDLNKGNGGDDLYLMATAEYGAGPALTALTKSQSGNGDTARNNLTNNGYTIATDQSGNYQDTNAGAGGDYNYVGYKSSCSTVDSSALRWAYKMGMETRDNGYVTTALTNALNSAANILNDLADGYTTSNQSAIDSAKNTVLNALPSISLNSQQTVNISANGEGYCYKFSAPSGASYAFWGLSDTNKDNCAYIYDASGTQKAYNDDIGTSNSRHTALGVHNYQHYTYVDMSSGTTYYLYTKMLNSTATNSYPVKVSKNRTIKFHSASSGADVEVANLPVGHPNTNFNTMAGFTRDGHTLVGWTNNAGKGFQTVKNVDTVPDNSDLYALWYNTSAPTLSVNTDYTAAIDYGYEMELYKFTPTKTKDYLIYGKSSTDTMVLLYDGNRASGTAEIASDDDDNSSVKSNFGVSFGQTGNNQFILKKTLTAGQTYYYGVKFYGNGTGSLPFRFEEIYTVSYNANGGSGAPTDVHTKFYGKDITLSSTQPTRDHYNFLGWSTSSSATSATYQPGATYSANADATLYAVWQPVQYGVTFNVNGGSSVADMSYNITDTKTFPTSTKTGYTLSSWKVTTAAGNWSANATFTPGSTFSGKYGNPTLTAQWTGVPFKVHFNGNGATNGTMSDQSFVYGTAQNLTANAFSRSHTVTYNYNYSGSTNGSATVDSAFAGWATSAGGNVAYTNQANGSTLTTTANATVNLFANWTLGTVTTPNPTRTGYMFSGWYENENYSGTRIGGGISYAPNADKTLYAKWTARQYVVSFNGNGATSGSMDNQTFTYDVAQNLSANAYNRAYTVTYAGNGGTPSKTGDTATATFNGWATSATGAKVYNNQQSVSNLAASGTFPLYANWTDASVTLPTATRTGYTLKGWYTAATGGSKYGDANDSYAPAADVTMTAQWAPVTYHITYQGDGVTTTVDEYNIESTGALPLPTREGYEFKGWLASDNTGNWTETTALADGTTLAGRWGDVTLTAQWEAASYAFTMTLEGATTENAPLSVDYDGTYSFTVTLDEGHNQTTPAITATNADVSYTRTGDVITVSLSNVTGPVTVNVPTVLNTYSLTITGDEGFSSNDTAKTVQHGNTLSFTVTLSEGYTNTAPTVTKNGETLTVKTVSGNDYTYEIENVTADVTVSVTATKNTYAVTFTADSGADAPAGQTITHGENCSFSVTPKTGYTQTAPTVTVNGEPLTAASVTNGTYNYVIESVKGAKAVVIATTINTYTVTFADDDGTVLKEKTYAHGTPAADVELPDDPTKDATQQYTYTFAGWGEIADVTADATYTASYTSVVNQYTVTFVDEDGTVLKAAKAYDYGTPAASIELPDDPTKDATQQYTYTFAGWGDIADVTDNVTYTASYTPTVNQYTVTFVDEDGTVLKEAKAYDYGTPAADIELPDDPTKDATQQYTYTFAGWGDIADVTDNVTYTASYTPTVNQYTVTFVDEDGTVLKAAVAYDYGTPAADIEMPDDPSKDADQQYTYTFAGWGDIADVTDNVTYTASYTPTVNQYTVTFVDEDGTVLKAAKAYDYGTPAADIELPDDPTKDATQQYTYTFAGWGEIADVTENVTYTATYSSTVNQYTVTFVDEDGETVLKEAKAYDYGTPAASIELPDDPTKPSTEQYSYLFAGWGDIADVTENVTYTASYIQTVRTYTVLWLNEDGTELEKDTGVSYGTMAEYNGETPTKARTAQYTYTFAGWDKTVGTVTGDVTYTATYTSTVNSYSVKFFNYDETLLDSQTLDYGAMPEYAGETPTKPADAQYTYTFAGWTPTVATVTDAAEYVARYDETVNAYTVKFVNGDTVLQEETLDYGTMPEYKGAEPSMEATAEFTYQFTGWDKPIATVTDAETYIAMFNNITNSYEVKFVNYNDEVLQEETLDYGTLPEYKGDTPVRPADAQYTYTFDGWDKTVGLVTGEVVYKATYSYTVNTYTITWVDEDGTELDSQVLAYGATPIYGGTDPTKAFDAEQHYAFAGWGDVVPVVGTATYTAVYTGEAHVWNDGTVSIAPTCAALGRKDFVCTVCGATKMETIEKDPTNHVGGTEVRGRIEPTEETDGYSGDIYCRSCDELLQQGTTLRNLKGYCPYCGGYHEGLLGAVITAIHGIVWLFHKAFRLIP